MTVLERVRARAGVRASLGNIGWFSSDRIVRLFGAVVVSSAVAGAGTWVLATSDC